MLIKLLGITFVASNLPPNPVSNIKKSALVFANNKKAATVVISKNVIGFLWFTDFTYCRQFNNFWWVILT